MIRLTVFISACLLTGVAAADQCHYFWTTDCFEIRDARTRDIVHHVLVSGGPYDAGQAESGQCPDRVQAQLDAEHRASVLKRFNKALGKLDGCRTLDQLEPRVFADGTTATEDWRRLQGERKFKQIHRIRKLPED